MAYKQLRDANWRISATGGWCLNYVQRAFGTGWSGSTATDAWQNRTSYKHAERPPLGITVPVFFSLGNEPAGHVAIRLDDGTVASSTLAGTQPTGYIHPNLDHMINMYAKYNGGCRYLGWTEDLGGTRLVKNEEDDMIPDTDNYYARYGKVTAKAIRGRELTRAEFSASIAGRTGTNALEILEDNPEAHRTSAALDLGLRATAENWSGQLDNLKNSVKSLNAEIESLKAQLKTKDAEKAEASQELEKAHEELERLKAEAAKREAEKTIKIAPAIPEENPKIEQSASGSEKPNNSTPEENAKTAPEAAESTENEKMSSNPSESEKNDDLERSLSVLQKIVEFLSKIFRGFRK